MEPRIEKAIKNLADRLGLSEKEIKAEMKEFTKVGFSEENALVQVQGNHSQAMRSIPGIFHILPVNIKRGNREREDVVHDVTDVTGLFHGVIERGGKAIPFISTMSLWDERSEKANVLNGEEWFKFKGFANPRRGTIGIGNSDEFQADTEAPDTIACLKQVADTCHPLNTLLKQNDAGEYVNHKQNLLVHGIVNRVPKEDERSPIEIGELGEEPLTIWPPYEGEFPEGIELGQEVLVYGYHQVKSGESSMTLRALFQVPQE